jgi:hypothetical protein
MLWFRFSFRFIFGPNCQLIAEELECAFVAKKDLRPARIFMLPTPATLCRLCSSANIGFIFSINLNHPIDFKYL